MKYYKLLKDLPTFNVGDEFVLKDDGCLYLKELETDKVYGQCHWKKEVMAYHRNTLAAFPNILEEWFEEIEKQECSESDAAMAVLKASLDFNSGVIALATAYAGNCTDRITYKRFKKEYKKMIDRYDNTINSIVEVKNERTKV